MVKKIWVKRFKGGPIESWSDVEAELGEPVEAVLRRANLLVEGADLGEGVDR